MDAHIRFIDCATMDLSLFKTYSNSDINIFDILFQMIDSYNIRLMSEPLSSQEIQSFHAVLCYYYQNTIGKQQMKTSPKNIFNSKIGNILQELTDDKFSTDQLFVNDIFILQLILFSNDTVKTKLEEFQILFNPSFQYGNVLKIFLDTIRLQIYLRTQKYNEEELKEIAKVFVEGLKIMAKQLESYKFPTFNDIVILSVKTFGEKSILPDLWNFFLDHVENPQLLSMLCFIIGSCWHSLNFTDKTPEVYPFDDYTLQKLFYKEQLWSFLLKELTSEIPQVRKQVLFIVKNVSKVEVFYQHMVFGKNEFENKNGIIPFVCKFKKFNDLGVGNLKKIFVLTLEALEETQKQFVMLAIENLEILVRGHLEHKDCGNCFSLLWLKMVFKRILSHENRTVVTQGLLFTLRLDPGFYNDDFIRLICKTLNEISFFKYDSSINLEDVGEEGRPEVVKELSNFFRRVEEQRREIISRFFIVATEINWNLVAIYHVVNTLNVSCEKKEHLFDDDCLKSITNIVEKCQSRPTKFLQYCFQRIVIKAITRYSRTENLTLIGNLFYLLLENEPREDIWEKVTHYLSNLRYIKENAGKFVVEAFENFPMEISVMEFTISLLAKAKIIFQNQNCPCLLSLRMLLSNLVNIDSRSYVEIKSVVKILEVISLFTKRKLKGSYEELNLIVGEFDIYWESIVNFIVKKVQDSSNLEYKDILILVETMEGLVLYKNVTSNLEKLKENCLEILRKDVLVFDNIRYPFAIRLLCTCAMVQKSLRNYKKNISASKYDKETVDLLLKIYKKSIHLEETDKKGGVISDYYRDILKIIAMNLELGFDQNILEEVENFFNFARKEIVQYVLDVVLGLCMFLDPKHELLENGLIFTMCWNATLDCKKSSYFLISAEKTIKIMGRIWKKKESLNEKQLSVVKKIIDEILKEGNLIPNLKISLLKHSALFACNDLRDQIFFNCIMHGNVLRQDQIIEIQTCDSILEIRDIYVTNKMSNDKNDNISQFASMCSYINYNLDAMTRFLSVLKILKNPQDNSSLMDLLMKRLMSYNEKRYFKDSYIHKVIQRILQILLITMDFDKLKDETEEIIKSLIKMLLIGNHQHSVRIMIEWIFTLCSIRIAEFREHYLWELLKSVKEKRPNTLYSVFRVIYNIYRTLEPADGATFCENALSQLSLSCMAQQYTTRLYSQVIFKKMYESQESTDIKTYYKCLYLIVEESLSVGNMVTNYEKLMQDFYITSFDATKHHNLDVILYDLPRLTNVCSTEYINRLILQNYTQEYVFSNLSCTLQSAQIPPYISDSAGTDNNEIRAEESGDVQKKMMPWKNFELPQKATKNDAEIIVVASLVERPPNLGGIARTCEIFSVTELLMANRKHMENKEFQNLSVSAEKWLDVTEVKPYNLSDYFLRKKKLGWSIIGAEQTVNSVNLRKVKFPKKTVLVLGNEKSGIPPNLIPLMDFCVEIPQTGITRSLNVHVTSAICIWQFASQHYCK